MIKEVGFFVLKLDRNNAYILHTIEEYIKNNPSHHCVLFNSHSDIEIPNNIPVLHLYHARFFYGTIVVYEVPGMIISNAFTNFNRRIFYANNVPWYGNAGVAAAYWQKVFQMENTDIIANNQYTYDIFDICLKTPLSISEDLNYEAIKQYV